MLITPASRRRPALWIWSCTLTLVLALAGGCDRKPAASTTTPTEPASVAAEGESAAPESPTPTAAEPIGAESPQAEPASAQPVLATEPFIERLQPDDLRLVSYNVKWDSIFPEAPDSTVEEFARVIKALGPDILLLQEINREADAVAALLDNLAPLPDGEAWQAYKGHSNIIASKHPLSLTADATVPRPFANADDPDRRARIAMALVDLPDDQFKIDLYVTNHHYKCCGDPGGPEDDLRQRQSDAMVNWFRDARTPGDEIDLPANAGLIIAGDLNMVGGLQPLTTAIDGNIIHEDVFGVDAPPDWDDTPLTDAHPLHNNVGPADYTWRNDRTPYAPGRLDFVIYSDSVLQVAHKFVLNTTTMSPELLERYGLKAFDVTMDEVGANFDHLPLVVDFRPVAGE